jgi:hypothetical protein
MNDKEQLKMYETDALRRELYQTAATAGLPIIPGLTDDKCCQLLAWLLIYGGANEQVVFDSKVTSAIFYAQARLNLFGGERVNIDLLPVLQNYIKSIANKFGVPYDNVPEWVIELEKEYSIKPHRSNK